MKKYRESIMKVVFLVAACVSILAVVLICGFLFVNGFPAIAEIGPLKFLTGVIWKPQEGEFGILPMIIGSIYATGIAILVGVPIGLLCSVFMARFCPQKLYKILKPAISLLAGIPSIVYGFFGLVVIVPIMQSIFGVGKSVLTAGILLGIMILPIGLLCSVFMARFCPQKLYKILKPAISLLAGIPSIVYGFFGLVVIVPIMQSIFGVGKSVLTAGILLGIMILPTIIEISESAIRAVPNSYYEGSLALGATHERSVYCATLPAAKSGIMAGIILGIGRAIGETMAVVMIAGNQTVIPKSLLSGVRTMTANIVMEMGYATDLHRGALIGTGVVLFVFILLINVCFSLVKKKEQK